MNDLSHGLRIILTIILLMVLLIVVLHVSLLTYKKEALTLQQQVSIKDINVEPVVIGLEMVQILNLKGRKSLSIFRRLYERS